MNAVQVFNNSLRTFKTEAFIVLMTIAWSYLLHAYYHRHGIEYRYWDLGSVNSGTSTSISGGRYG